ncbi:ROK family protein [Alkalihalobacillus sp. 1P02AB]|uniref:ROK family protein n=1 Tax=Alkalihalobacillus sp. 1P02AB TaxID=3132260 RepID=UPI0039A552D3
MIQTSKLAIGVDIGGTNIKMGLVTSAGELVEFQSLLLKRNVYHSADIEWICKTVKQFIHSNGIDDRLTGVGVASPGILDIERGVVANAVNLGWENIQLVKNMEHYLNLDVSLVSDSVAGALGEQNYSAADMADYLFICIGTGLGASHVIKGFSNGTKVETINLGHMSIIPNGKKCICGNQGCLEKYVSASALIERARNDMGETKTILKQYAEINGRLEAHHIHEAACKGDSYSLQLFREAGEWLGISIVNCIHLFGSKNIIIGGGLSRAGTYLLEPMQQEITKRYPKNDLHISFGTLPTKSGVLGAASLVFK